MDMLNNDECQFCYDKVIFRCMPCKVALCKDCVAVHIKMTSTISHKIVLSEEGKEEKRRQLFKKDTLSSGFENMCDVSYQDMGLFYICSEQCKVIKKLNLSGKEIDSFKATKSPLCVKSCSNGVLYTEFGIKAVMFYIRGRIKHLFSTGDWQPQGVNTTKAGNILLTLRRNKEAKLVTFSQHGNVCSEIQYQDREPLYCDPWYVVESPRGYLCVSDQGKSSVICVRSDGELIFQYYGHRNSFYPRGLCSDATSHFIVADPWNNKLHYISSCGEFICYLEYESMDSPTSISNVADKPNNFLICEIGGFIHSVEM
ncbi:uncharacterized protein LOC133183476 [Saccostrea echinata]|uniref:uncharacterized protein LOC133183476 n=1 Tax=Saccostrea echinata TaxID=191078 RepID=UPI002A80B386|nr:uncharacterized protein LOC133183476 [Saccostrea echinata]